MPLRTAILGWGSLIWEGGAFDKWHDDWRCDGPMLNLEFSRVSESRLRALTLVIDRDHGVPIQVAWCLSRRDDPSGAQDDLRSREGTTVRNICRVSLAQPALNLADEAFSIAVWGKRQALDAVVWTGLSSNFESATGKPFSVDRALAHLRSLPTLSKAKAAEYLSKAPEFIKTPLRTAVQEEKWFLERAHKSESEARERKPQ
jgi:hypothetical protein